MLKRWVTGFGGVLLMTCFTILIWQPDRLKTQLLHYMAKEVSQSTPYELSLARVSGNLFTGFTLQDVHVQSKEEHSELLNAKAIKIGISWWALFHKTIRI